MFNVYEKIYFVDSVPVKTTEICFAKEVLVCGKKLEAHSVQSAFHELRKVGISGTPPKKTVMAMGLEIFTHKLCIRRIDSKYLSLSIDDANFQRKIANAAHSAKTHLIVFSPLL